MTKGEWNLNSRAFTSVSLFQMGPKMILSIAFTIKGDCLDPRGLIIAAFFSHMSKMFVQFAQNGYHKNFASIAKDKDRTLFDGDQIRCAGEHAAFPIHSILHFGLQGMLKTQQQQRSRARFRFWRNATQCHTAVTSLHSQAEMSLTLGGI